MITKMERYRKIVVVLARHGIGVVGDEFIKHEAGDRARAEHLRRGCEELGTMFIKFGQILSTRSDLLPGAYRVELAKRRSAYVADTVESLRAVDDPRILDPDFLLAWVVGVTLAEHRDSVVTEYKLGG